MFFVQKCKKRRLNRVLSAKSAICLNSPFRCEKCQCKDSGLGSFRTCGQNVHQGILSTGAYYHQCGVFRAILSPGA